MSPLPPSPFPFRSLAVVLNPQAGRGLALREWPRLEAALNAHTLPWSWLSAASAEDALSRVQALPPGTAVLAVGGDGTVNRLLPALVGTGRMLGLVPLGTGNDFAGMLGLKPGNFDSALSRLSRPPRAADVLRCTYSGAGQTERQEWLMNGLGMGFDAQVAALLLKAPAQLPGLGRYLWAALSAVRQLKTETVEVLLGGQTLYAGPSCLVAVMNGTRYGGGFMISPTSDAFDGQLNVVLGTQLSRPRLLALMLKVLRASHMSDPRVRSGSGQSVTVRWQSGVVSHLDGELIGTQRQISVELVAGAVQLLSAPV
ncbi:diacylglycerol kinase family lipid kinase [Deinococcus psychrotolerans]|uniref:Diacylglycerol kinase family lipid kinase n=1 Tax=Deinococcus psychrotolerans TaxID=2489213 RepID=A0A3G8YFN7_9DEIO|nr:diacylglycerol kinase family lipid kinase [Deinococcus psychrotolerans]